MEPGAFRTRAYAGFADEPVEESIEEYRSMLTTVRAGMIEQNGRQPGDPVRDVEAVVAAVDRDHTPRRLVLGNAGYDRVADNLEAMLAELRADEAVSRGADFPAAADTWTGTGG